MLDAPAPGRERQSQPTRFPRAVATGTPHDPRHGDVDICFEPAGFSRGYDDLRPQATVQAIAGTTIALPIASLGDVEHSKRTADRAKDRAYF